MNKYKVAVVDDHLLFLEGIKSVINSMDEVEKVIIANSTKELIPLLFQNKPELLLLDLNLAQENGLEFIGKIKKEFPLMRIMVLTSYDDPKFVKKAFRSGADGYMLKNSPKDGLLAGILDVLKGHVFLGEGVSLPTVDSGVLGPKTVFQMDDRFIQKNNLTKREVEILQLVGQAMSNKEIADQLFISDQTVSVHKKNLMRKLGVNSTASLVKIAFKTKLVK